MNMDLFINDIISINWDRYQLIPTVQDAWDYYSEFTQVINKFQSFKVQNAIKQLRLSSGAGPDGIEARYIKLASRILMFPLAELFNLSLDTCEIPAMWKYS